MNKGQDMFKKKKIPTKSALEKNNNKENTSLSVKIAHRTEEIKILMADDRTPDRFPTKKNNF
jgi:hypothetical protein